MALRKAWLVFMCIWHLLKGTRIEIEDNVVKPIQWLPWKPTLSYYNTRAWSTSTTPGTLGIELELLIRKDKENWWKRQTAAVTTWGVEKLIDPIASKIKEQLDNNGIDFEIVLNRCKCFIGYHLDKDLNVLPFLIKIKGVRDHYKLSLQSGQMRTVTLGLMEQLREGAAPPSGADKTFVPIDDKGQKIQSLKDTLNDNKALKDATRHVRIIDLSQYALGMMNFSEHQFLVELELEKYAVLGNALPGTFSAALVGNVLKAGSAKELTLKIYSEVSRGLVDGTAANGINTFVSSPKTASRLFSGLPVLEPNVARAFHSMHKVEPPEDYTSDFRAFSKKEALPPINDIDPYLATWRGYRGEKSVFGLRMVVTVTSLNEKFASSKLPDLRDGVADALGKELEGALSPLIPSLQVNVYKCGFNPSHPETPPYNERAELGSAEWPHDKQCGEPPSK